VNFATGRRRDRGQGGLGRPGRREIHAFKPALCW
jgi:hypothetical protein